MKGTCVTCGKPLGEARFFVCTDCVPEEMYHDEVRHGSVLGLAVERAEKVTALVKAAKRAKRWLSESGDEEDIAICEELGNAIELVDAHP